MAKNQCEEIKSQFNRIRGQMNGIAKMIEEERDAIEIVQQISAARSALSRLAIEVLKEESQECLNSKKKDDKIKRFEKLVTDFFKITN